MSPVVLIASNTIRQVVRQKVFYNVLLFGLGMLILSMLVGNITFGFPDRVVRSIGLSGVSLALDLLALLTGVTLVHEELDRKSVYVVLTRPVARGQYIAGRLLGLLCTLLLITVALVVVFGVVLELVHGSMTSRDLMSIVASLAEASVLAAIAVVFSTFTSPTLGAGMAIGVWIVCATTDDLVGLSAKHAEFAPIARVVSYVFPSFARLNFRESAVYALDISTSYWLLGLGYSACYTVAFAVIATVIFSRRELI